ncbi:alpha/beta hydrolase [Sphingomonas sp. SUN039]|uniref:alpha/beta hydrolase n=1 Tax=Sphingomonas sp. SUN039 TaxID=2937787 RepID=UPI0021646A1E|nr:alpha/beta hydrolase [Sphingomonas sp. SUN039]UVO53112.1 alpha/beta hydrolase [Sphingomonas sp. SUN039]
MKKVFFTALALGVSICTPASAQENIVLRFEDSRKIDYPGEVALGTGKGQPKEEWFRESGSLQVRNVESATLTPFLPPAGARTGAAVIVAPGGAFLGLAIEEEGYRVARWLTDHGIAAFVLKYRLLPTPADPATFRKEVSDMRTGKGPASFRPPAETPPEALADGQAAIRYVRAHAAQFGVDPDRVGMMGFSAGAMTTMSVALANAPDARPAFIAPIYGRQDAVTVPANPPPLFVALATNDPLFWKGGTGLIDSWGKAGGKVEFHLYQNGAHGFGLGAAGTTTVDWMNGFRRWLEVNGLLVSKN